MIKGSDGAWAVALYLAAVSLAFAGLGLEPLRDWDEGTFAQVAREMAAGGWATFLHPTIWAEPYLNKPPLGIGLMALGMGLFGETAFGVRAPMALIAAGTAPGLFVLLRRSELDRTTALAAGAVCVTFLPLMRHGRLAMLDGVVVTLGILALLWIWRARDGAWIWAGAAGLVLGLATLTKGLLAVPFLAIGLVWLWAASAPGLRQGRVWAALAAGLLPAVVWYGLQLAHYGPASYADTVFYRQGLARVVSEVEGNRGPVWYYVVEILKYGWPWLIFLPLGLREIWRQRAQPYAALLLIWAGGYLLLISLMPTKLPWYIHPAWPPLAAMCGIGLVRAINAGGLTSRALPVIGVAGLALAGYAGPWGPDPVVALMGTGLLLAAGAFGAFWIWGRSGPRAALVLVGCVYGALLCFAVSERSVWENNEDYPVLPIAAAIHAHVPATAPLSTTHPHHRPALNFYAGRGIPTARIAGLQTAARAETESYWVTTEAILSQHVDGPYEILATVAPIVLARVGGSAPELDP